MKRTIIEILKRIETIAVQIIGPELRMKFWDSKPKL